MPALMFYFAKFQCCVCSADVSCAVLAPCILHCCHGDYIDRQTVIRPDVLANGFYLTVCKMLSETMYLNQANRFLNPSLAK